MNELTLEKHTMTTLAEIEQELNETHGAATLLVEVEKSSTGDRCKGCSGTCEGSCSGNCDGLCIIT